MKVRFERNMKPHLLLIPENLQDHHVINSLRCTLRPYEINEVVIDSTELATVQNEEALIVPLWNTTFPEHFLWKV